MEEALSYRVRRPLPKRSETGIWRCWKITCLKDIPFPKIAVVHLEGRSSASNIAEGYAHIAPLFVKMLPKDMFQDIEYTTQQIRSNPPYKRPIKLFEKTYFSTKGEGDIFRRQMRLRESPSRIPASVTGQSGRKSNVANHYVMVAETSRTRPNSGGGELCE